MFWKLFCYYFQCNHGKTKRRRPLQVLLASCPHPVSHRCPANPIIRAPQRSASTSAAAHPPAQPQAPVAHPPTYQQPGVFSQIMTTAAGVAVGHTVGRMITGLFPGSSGAAPGEVASGDMATQERCGPDVKRFVECMREHHEDMAACQQYYEMMAACAKQTA